MSSPQIIVCLQSVICVLHWHWRFIKNETGPVVTTTNWIYTVGSTSKHEQPSMVDTTNCAYESLNLLVTTPPPPFLGLRAYQPVNLQAAKAPSMNHAKKAIWHWIIRVYMGFSTRYPWRKLKVKILNKNGLPFSICALSAPGVINLGANNTCME